MCSVILTREMVTGTSQNSASNHQFGTAEWSLIATIVAANLRMFLQAGQTDVGVTPAAVTADGNSDGTRKYGTESCFRFGFYGH